MNATQRARLGRVAVAAVVLATALLVVGTISPEYRTPLALAAVGVVAIPVGLFLVLAVDPAWTLTGAILLSTFSSRWEDLGFPNRVVPDRALLAVGLIAVAMRVPAARLRPHLRVDPVHWALLVAVLYALCSAVVAEEIGAGSIFRIVDRYGAVPFLMFLVAPVAFHSRRQRNILLGGLVAWGAYLGGTAFVETVGPEALVWPRYILDESIGLHGGRTRGPFTEAVTDGEALFTCAVACGLAVLTWRGPRARLAAAAIGLLCLAGTLFTLQRSVWVGTALGIVVLMVAARELRRFVVPAAVIGVAGVAIALAVVPSLAEEVNERKNDQQTIYDRQNLNTAALNMTLARPLFGFGWETFEDRSSTYFELNPDYPLTATANVVVHNVFLTHAAELGLVGLTIWLAAVLWALIGACVSRAPPAIRPWQIGLVGLVVHWLIVASFVYPLLFPILVMWTWAGIVYGNRSDPAPVVVEREPGALEHPPQPRAGALVS